VEDLLEKRRERRKRKRKKRKRRRRKSKRKENSRKSERRKRKQVRMRNKSEEKKNQSFYFSSSSQRGFSTRCFFILSPLFLHLFLLLVSNPSLPHPTCFPSLPAWLLSSSEHTSVSCLAF
jgi:Flp pilus assembly protein TadB